jgi:hypothetical protein
LTAPLGENGKLHENRLEIGRDLSVPADGRAEPEVFENREAGEDLTSLGNQRSAEPHDLAARDVVDRATADFDAASRSGRDGADRRQGAVRADDGNDLTRVDVECYVLDGGHGIIGDPQILDAKDRFAAHAHADALSGAPR